eukprot:gene16618-19742_t
METQYELDKDGNAIMYDALVVKAQLAFFGTALRDHHFTGPAFADYTNVVCAPPAQGTEGRRFLLLLETKDNPPVPHFVVLMCVGRKGAKPCRWLCSLRARACTYDTYEEFVKEEAPRYGKIENVFEMEAGEKYESMDSYLQAIKATIVAAEAPTGGTGAAQKTAQK